MNITKEILVNIGFREYLTEDDSGKRRSDLYKIVDSRGYSGIIIRNTLGDNWAYMITNEYKVDADESWRDIYTVYDIVQKIEELSFALGEKSEKQRIKEVLGL